MCLRILWSARVAERSSIASGVADCLYRRRRRDVRAFRRARCASALAARWVGTACVAMHTSLACATARWSSMAAATGMAWVCARKARRRWPPRARRAREILAFYFPGTAVRILPGDDGWQETRVGAITVRSAQPLTAEQRTALLSRRGTRRRSDFRRGMRSRRRLCSRRPPRYFAN